MAAAIRTGRLAGDGPPAPSRLFALPLFAAPRAFVYYGTDPAGHRVYAFWCRGEAPLFYKFFRARQKLFGEAEWLLRPVPDVACVTWLSLAWRLARSGCPFGRWLFCRALARCYPHLVRLAAEEA
ncbi:DUF3189 family protein [Thermodesulfitimonas autotrophica]|uniref:DUF3189 family protein n=1 Tax=Thermodesulfitimonas autotrophica TaxID=1894989 RepID=UPI002FDFC4DB